MFFLAAFCVVRKHSSIHTYDLDSMLISIRAQHGMGFELLAVALQADNSIVTCIVLDGHSNGLHAFCPIWLLSCDCV